jgi:hypothetical protein
MTTMPPHRLDMSFPGGPGRTRWPQVSHIAVLLAVLLGCTPMAGPSVGGEPPSMPHKPTLGDPAYKATSIQGTLRGAIMVLRDDPAYAALQGLTALGVSVEPFDPALAHYGVTSPEVQRAVEERLHQVGLRVLTVAELATAPGSPTLQLELEAPQPGPLNTYSYRMRLVLLQHVVLERDPALRVPAVPTWVIEYRTTSSAARLHEMQADVLDLVDRFLTSYQYVRTPPEQRPQGWPPWPAPAAPQ